MFWKQIQLLFRCVIELTRLIVNLFKITSLACSPRLICGGVRKLHYESHDSDHMLRTLQMAIWINMKDLRFRVKMMCLLRTIRLFKKSIICIYHIIKYSWHRFTLNWTVMWFLYISHATVKGSKWEICFNQIGRKVPLKYILQHHLFRWQKLQWTKEKGDKMTNAPQSTIQTTDRQTDNRQTDRQTDRQTAEQLVT